MIEPSDVRLMFPEFSDTYEFPCARIQLYIDLCNMEMGTNEAAWSGFYDVAKKYLTAHKLVLGMLTASGQTRPSLGFIVSKTADGVSVTRSPVDLGDDYLEYSTSSYGIEFVKIRRQLFARVLVV